MKQKNEANAESQYQRVNKMGDWMEWNAKH